MPRHKYHGMPLTAEILRELLTYNPETGVFVRRVTLGKIKAGMVAGSPSSHGYLLISVAGTRYKAHRLAWLYVYGEWPKEDIDHINRVTSDNRICNLREATDHQNLWNMKKPITNSSGYKGVSYHALTGKWRVRFRRDGKEQFIGLFHSKEIAFEVYKEEITRVRGEFVGGI